MIDDKGYRHNVGIVLCNDRNQLFWARRVNQGGWQFPQGGVQEGEAPDDAMYRELYEEIGLKPAQVELMGKTGDWAYYDLPERFIRRGSLPLCVGQKQIWYLLRFTGNEDDISFDCSDQPEFDRWRWVDYWEPAFDVIYFKRDVYLSALTEMWSFLYPGITPNLPKN